MGNIICAILIRHLILNIVNEPNKIHKKKIEKSYKNRSHMADGACFLFFFFLWYYIVWYMNNRKIVTWNKYVSPGITCYMRLNSSFGIIEIFCCTNLEKKSFNFSG